MRVQWMVTGQGNDNEDFIHDATSETERTHPLLINTYDRLSESKETNQVGRCDVRRYTASIIVCNRAGTQIA